MAHSVAGLMALVLPIIALCLSVAPAAPAPPDTPEAVLYFPTKVGGKWVYWDGTREVTKLVSKVEKRDEEKVVTVVELMAGGRKVPAEKVTVSETGLSRVELGMCKFEAPLRLVKVPHKPGDRWEIRTSYSPGTAEKGTATVHELEDLKVPAGTYKTVRMVYEFVHEGKPQRSTIWFAPGVGLVKLEDSDDTRQVLKSFTPGRE
ncbi:MAG: hypothetical protein JWO38_3228 [Gemmataceae bacterium]|nr:hypothetical protein [Gemmataceae bacterium]